MTKPTIEKMNCPECGTELNYFIEQVGKGKTVFIAVTLKDKCNCDIATRISLNLEVTKMPGDLVARVQERFDREEKDIKAIEKNSLSDNRFTDLIGKVDFEKVPKC